MTGKAARKTRPQLLSDRITVDSTLRFIAQRGWKQKDGDFFPALTAHLAESLGVAFALVGRVVPDRQGEVETVALYAHGAHAPNMEYSLPGSPCEKVLKEGLCCYPKDVRQGFPSFAMLGELNAESYAGIA
ncbi:MAG: hypothetical protein D6773_17565, partial [Alphaproteobacteria bacterium]